MTAPYPAMHPPPLPLLVLLVAVSQVGAAMYAPSIPAMAEAFRRELATVQLTMTVFLIGYAFSQVVVGSLADRYGRRPVMLCGVGLFAIASVLAALAPTLELLIAARFVQSFGASAGIVLGRAVVRDCYGPADSLKYMAYLGMAAGLTPALSPSIGGLLQVWFGWQANFVAMAALGAAGLILAGLLLHETLPAEDRGGSRPADLLHAYRILLRDARFLAYAVTVAGSTGVFFVFITGGPVVLIGFEGITPDVYGLYALAMPAGFVMGNFLSSRYAGRIGINRAIQYGNLFSTLFALPLLGIALSGHMSGLAFFLPLHLIGWAAGFIVPNGFAGAVSGDPRIAGAASGLSGFMQMVSGAIATLLVGLIAPNGFLTFAVLLTAVAAVGWASFVLLMLLARRQGR